MIRQLAFFLALAASSSHAVELTNDNYAAETDGKTVLLKFYAPWCGHCKALKPDWDKLMAEFAGSSTQLVGDVDCTAGGQELCEDVGVDGYPTLKWGDPDDLQDYDGERSFEALEMFAYGNLKPMCSVKNMDLCEGDKKAQIKTYMDMTVDELEAIKVEGEGKMQEIVGNYEKQIEELEEKFEELDQEKDDAIAAVRASGLSMVKNVLKSKKAPEVKDEL